MAISALCGLGLAVGKAGVGAAAIALVGLLAVGSIGLSNFPWAARVLAFSCGAFLLVVAVKEWLPGLPLDLIDFGKQDALFCAVLFLILIVLPLLNAIVDLLSVATTRYFLRRIDAGKLGAWGVLAGLVFDIVIALGCLSLLLWLITQSLDLWAYIAPAVLPFDWRAYRDMICSGDWQDGTMLWLMLGTTLAPTAFHLAAGAGAIASHRARVDAEILAILTPAQQQVQTTYAGVPETGDGSLARRVLDADAINRLQDLLGHREGVASLWSMALFGLFMALLIGAVLALAQTLALPVLCPAPPLPAT